MISENKTQIFFLIKTKIMVFQLKLQNPKIAFLIKFQQIFTF